MTAGISTIFPPAGQSNPATELQEKTLAMLRAELAAQTDRGLAALLLHEMARIHEQRDDLAAAARDELAATKQVAGFVEPLESLLGIAMRSRSRENVIKLLTRLLRLAKRDEEKLRAHLCLIALHREGESKENVQTQLEEALEQLPAEPTLWLLLEILAFEKKDLEELKRATTGRAAHARSAEFRGLLLQRLARLHRLSGDDASALDMLQQAVDETPSWRALFTLEKTAAAQKDYLRAAQAARDLSAMILASVDETGNELSSTIPRPERTLTRAFAAEFRAVLYSALAEDWLGAEDGLRALEQIVPASTIGLVSQAEISRRSESEEELREALGKLRRETTNSAQDKVFWATLMALASQDTEEQNQILQDVLGYAPESQAARMLILRALEAEGPRELQTYIEGDARIVEAARNEGDSDPSETVAAVTRAICLLAEGQFSAAFASFFQKSRGSDYPRSRRSDPPSSAEPSTADNPATLGSKARHGEAPGGKQLSGTETAFAGALAHFCRDPEMQDRTRIALARLATNASERAALRWSERRADFLDGVPFEPVGTPWGQLLLGLIQNAGAARVQIESFVSRTETPEELRQALSALVLMLPPRANQSADEDSNAFATAIQRTVHAFGEAAPFTVGLQLDGNEFIETTESLVRLSERVQDPTLRAGWLLRGMFRAAADPLARPHLNTVISKLESHADALGSLQSWVLASRLGDDPIARMHALESSPTNEGRSLEYLCLVHQHNASHFADAFAERLRRGALTPAEQTLSTLCYRLRPDYIERADHHDTRFCLISSKQDEIVNLADCKATEPEELLRTIEEVLTDQSVPSALTRWAAARRAGNTRRAAEEQILLAQETGNIRLLVHVDADGLSDDAASQRLTTLMEARRTSLSPDGAAGLSGATAPGGPAVSSDGPMSDIATASGDNVSLQSRRRTHAEVAWALAAECDDDRQGEELMSLAQIIDPELSDVDAQLAALCAGFRHLAEGRYAESLAAFSPLLQSMPSDLTLCHGVRIAAHQLQRFDLEAQVTRELARHAVDNLSSAELWERAGLLFQDKLQDETAAEECFNSALARSPGSPIAFERIYRIARSREDRPRLVDLLDARLATADSETLQAELYWEKARYCRMLGRRSEALSAVQQLWQHDPEHLPSLALAAELYLMDGSEREAARCLRDIAIHPHTPQEERKATGLFACDLLERVGEARQSVELIQRLEELGIESNASLARKGRSLAKSGDWGAAYDTFAQLNDQQDDLEERRESAKMMLAIQRDQLRDAEAMKDAVRRLLRDAPEDPDAVDLALNLHFDPTERQRLLTPARERCRRNLRANPLNADEMRLLANLCREGEDSILDRVSWGILALTGTLEPEETARLSALRERTPRLPSHAWSDAELQSLCAPGQVGTMGELAKLLCRYMAPRVEPSLQALGVSSLMRVDEFSESTLRQEVGRWCSSFGISDFELYVGGINGQMILGLNRDLPTLLIGADVQAPLGRVDGARLCAQLQALRTAQVVLLNQPLARSATWCRAAGLIATGQTSENQNPEENEVARELASALPRQDRETLEQLVRELSRTSLSLDDLPHATLLASARAATAAFGDPSVIRELSELLPGQEERRHAMIANLVRYSLSDEFFGLRRRAGLERA